MIRMSVKEVIRDEANPLMTATAKRPCNDKDDHEFLSRVFHLLKSHPSQIELETNEIRSRLAWTFNRLDVYEDTLLPIVGDRPTGDLRIDLKNREKALAIIFNKEGNEFAMSVEDIVERLYPQKQINIDLVKSTPEDVLKRITELVLEYNKSLPKDPEPTIDETVPDYLIVQEGKDIPRRWISDKWINWKLSWCPEMSRENVIDIGKQQLAETLSANIEQDVVVKVSSNLGSGKNVEVIATILAPTQV